MTIGERVKGLHGGEIGWMEGLLGTLAGRRTSLVLLWEQRGLIFGIWDVRSVNVGTLLGEGIWFGVADAQVPD